MNHHELAVEANATKTGCSFCNLQQLCLPVSLNAGEMLMLEGLIRERRRVPKGSSLYRLGDPFVSIYAVRTGFFKTSVCNEEGRHQVTGFQMTGELLGFDGIGSDRHTCDALALEDSVVCVVRFAEFETVAFQVKALQHHMHRIMGREISRDHGVMLLLGSMHAEARLAAFILNLVSRLKSRGFSTTDLVLRMSRDEIGSYIGLKLETVSRAFSKLADEGILEVKLRHIRVLNEVALTRLAEQP